MSASSAASTKQEREEKDDGVSQDSSSTLNDSERVCDDKEEAAGWAKGPKAGKRMAILRSHPRKAILIASLVLAFLTLVITLPVVLVTLSKKAAAAKSFPPVHAGCTILQPPARIVLQLDPGTHVSEPAELGETFGVLFQLDKKSNRMNVLQGRQNETSDTLFRFQSCNLPFMGFENSYDGSFGQVQVQGGKCVTAGPDTSSSSTVFHAEDCSYDDTPLLLQQWFRMRGEDVRPVLQKNSSLSLYNASHVYNFYAEVFTSDPVDFPNTCRLLAQNKTGSKESLYFQS